MKTAIPLSVSLFLLLGLANRPQQATASATLFIVGSIPAVITTGGGCYAAIYCDAPNCVPVPTSLPAVYTGVEWSTGWDTAGGSCGTKRCWGFIRCPCGPSLVSGACG